MGFYDDFSEINASHMQEKERAISPIGRPIFVASYRPPEESSLVVPGENLPTMQEVSRSPFRKNFPSVDVQGLDGSSDGYEYKTTFAGSSLEHSYDMIRAFLREEGYADIPLPRNAAELQRFRLPTRNRQILLFEDNGYVHNPVKILFPLDRRKKNALILCIYNEADPDHLLKFHGICP